MFPAFLLYILIAAIITGLLLWINGEIPYDATIKQIVRVVIIVCFCIWLLYVLVGVLPAAGSWGPPMRHP